MEANQEEMRATISTIQSIQTKFKETTSKEMEGVLASVTQQTQSLTRNSAARCMG
jgi:hypothetical protein